MSQSIEQSNYLKSDNQSENINKKIKSIDSNGPKNIINYEDSNQLNLDIQKNSPTENKKRHRRGKFPQESRDFKCPDCQKCYLSSTALKNHRKIKHGFLKDKAKKGRGRPKKEFSEVDYLKKMKEKSKKFFEDEKRKKINNEKIDTSFIKTIFNDLFIKYKNELFKDIDDLKNYNFYKFIINNWEKKNPEIEKKSYFSMINCPKADSIVDKPSIDEVFFLYMKYLEDKINKDYFSFFFKYVIIFREFINKEKKEAITKYLENKSEYTQIYDSEIIPDLFNDFLIDFMEPHNYFNLDKDEVINMIEYFAYWIYSEGYTNTNISKIE